MKALSIDRHGCAADVELSVDRSVGILRGTVVVPGADREWGRAVGLTGAQIADPRRRLGASSAREVSGRRVVDPPEVIAVRRANRPFR
jgi:hypothetical protein